MAKKKVQPKGKAKQMPQTKKAAAPKIPGGGQPQQVQIDPNEIINLGELPMGDVALMLKALGGLPHDQVSGTIGRLNGKINLHLNAKSEAQKGAKT